MANISTFELLVKRIAPLVGNPLIDAPFRRAVQGYFLTIANPNNRQIDFRIRARIPVWDAAKSPDPLNARELIGGTAANRNHIYTYDVTGGTVNGQVVYEPMVCRTTTFSGNQRILITRNLSLLPGQTAAFKLLPDIVSPAVNLADPALEIRGYLEFVQLDRLVLNYDPATGAISISIVDAPPADLLFTPEQRGTFLDNNYPGGTDLDFDQIAYSLPTGDGSARMTITASESPLIFCPFPVPLNPGTIAARLDASDRVILDDKGLRGLERELKKLKKETPDLEIGLAELRDKVERVLNQPGTIKKKKGK